MCYYVTTKGQHAARWSEKQTNKQTFFCVNKSTPAITMHHPPFFHPEVLLLLRNPRRSPRALLSSRLIASAISDLHFLRSVAARLEVREFLRYVKRSNLLTFRYRERKSAKWVNYSRVEQTPKLTPLASFSHHGIGRGEWDKRRAEGPRLRHRMGSLVKFTKELT